METLKGMIIMKDYSKFSEKYNNKVNIKDANIVEEHENIQPTEPTVEPVVDPVVDPVDPVEPTVEPVVNPVEPTTDPVVDTQEVGVVNIPRLNVRAEAKGDADIITVIKKDTEVVIDRCSSTEEFYKVIVDNVEGYCMKKFINIK
jgi:hypothetical protein